MNYVHKLCKIFLFLFVNKIETASKLVFKNVHESYNFQIK